VTAYNECGVATSEDVVVTFDAPPVVPEIVVEAPDGFCEGAQVTLSVTNAAESDEVFWTPGNVNTDDLVVTSAGTYSATVVNGCGTSTPTNETVTYFPIPATPFITLNGSGELVSSVTGDSYLWQFNGVPLIGNTSQMIVPEAEGVYSVTVISAEGCSGISSEPFSYTITGIHQHGSTRIEMFPNPAETFVTLILPVSVAGKVVSIYDMSGRIVKSFNLTGQSEQLLSLDLNPGMYWLQSVSFERQKLIIR
jgi:hypothetical protein